MENNLIKKFATFVFMSLFFICTPLEKINAQDAPKVKIISAEYGIFDNQVRTGEYVAFLNIGYNKFLAYDSGDHTEGSTYGWITLPGPEFNISKVFEIQKDFNVADPEKTGQKRGTPGYIIRDNDPIRLRIVSSSTPLWVSLKQRVHPSLPIGTWDCDGNYLKENPWTAEAKDSKDADSLWKLDTEKTYEKYVKKIQPITNRMQISLVSMNPERNSQCLQMYGVNAPHNDRAIVRSKGAEYKDIYNNYKPNARRFEIIRLAPEPNRFDPLLVKPINLLAKPQIMASLQDSTTGKIDWPTETDKDQAKRDILRQKPEYDWNQLSDDEKIRLVWDNKFGNPSKDSTGMSNLWNQIKIRYQLANGDEVYEVIYNQYDEIKIPHDDSKKSAEDKWTQAQNLMKGKSDYVQAFQTAGFSKAPGELSQISIAGKNAVGFNSAQDVFQWDVEKKSWKTIAQKTIFPTIFNDSSRSMSIAKIKQIAIGYDGAILVLLDIDPNIVGSSLSNISIKTNLYELQNGKLQPVQLAAQSVRFFRSFSMSSKSNIWATAGNNFSIYNLDLIKQQTKNIENTYTLDFITTGADGTTFGLGYRDKQIYKWIGGTNYNSRPGWEKVDGPENVTFKQICVGSSRYVWGTDGNYAYQLTENGWISSQQNLPSGIVQVAVNNIGELWVLFKEASLKTSGNYQVFYPSTEKEIWALGNKASIKNSRASLDFYLSVDNNSIWTLLNSKNKDDYGTLSLNSLIILKAENGKFLSLDENNNFAVKETDVSKAAKIKIINSFAAEDVSEIDKTKTTPISFIINEKYISVQNGKLVLVDTKDSSSNWLLKKSK